MWRKFQNFSVKKKQQKQKSIFKFEFFETTRLCLVELPGGCHKAWYLTTAQIICRKLGSNFAVAAFCISSAMIIFVKLQWASTFLKLCCWRLYDFGCCCDIVYLHSFRKLMKLIYRSWLYSRMLTVNFQQNNWSCRSWKYRKYFQANWRHLRRVPLVASYFHLPLQNTGW